MTEARRQDSKNIKRGLRVWLAYFMLSFLGYSLNVAGPAVAYLREELNFSYTESGLHTSALALGLVVTGLLGHHLLRRIPEWKALGLGGLGLGLGGLILISANQPALTLTGLFIMGVIGALILAVTPAVLADEMGRYGTVGVTEANTVAAIFSTIAPIAVGFFGARAVTWRPAVSLVTSLAFLIGLYILVSPQFSWKTESVETQKSTSKGKLPWKYWLFWTALVSAVSIEFCMIFWSAEYLQVHLAMPKDQATQLVSLFLVGMVIGRFAGSKLLQKFDRYLILLASLALGVLGFAIFWFSPSSWLALIGLFLTGLGVANLYATTVTLVFDAAGAMRASAGSGTTLASGVAILLLPFALGSLADLIGINLAILLVFLLFVVMIILILYGRKVMSTREEITETYLEVAK